MNKSLAELTTFLNENGYIARKTESPLGLSATPRNPVHSLQNVKIELSKEYRAWKGNFLLDGESIAKIKGRQTEVEAISALITVVIAKMTGGGKVSFGADFRKIWGDLTKMPSP